MGKLRFISPSVLLCFLLASLVFFISNTQTLALIPQDENPQVMQQDPGTRGGSQSSFSEALERIRKKQLRQYYLDFFRRLQFLKDGSAPYTEPTVTPTNYQQSLTPTVAPTVPPMTENGFQVNQSFASLKALYTQIGSKVGVPACVLEAVSRIEYPTAWRYTVQEVNQFSTPGQVIPNCPLNACSASGHMQMTIGVDQHGDPTCPQCCWHNTSGTLVCKCPNAWSGYGNTIKSYENDSHQPNVCNLKDSTYAAAAKLRHDSGMAPGQSWDSNAYLKAGRSYYGECTTKHDLNNRGIQTPRPMTYCEYLEFICTL